MNNTALIIDDDRTERRIVGGIIRKALKLIPVEAENGADALRMLSSPEAHNIKLVVLDIDMPVMNGLEMLEKIDQASLNAPVIVLTGSKNTQDAVRAMQLGACDFLSKPVEDARLDVSARNALKMSLMSQEISRLQRRAEDSLQFSDLIGFNTGLAESVQTGKKAANCTLPVLITGETGTGKEVLAQAIHGESDRAGKKFIAVNCGAIPEKLVESTLFGHEKGAFTGATCKAIGKFQEASGGTIFLDEIGDLPLDAQVKLLRVLQQQEIEPVGASRPVRVDVRVISATNRDLASEVQKGRFREDLYFRLNVLHINLLPLRARKEDIADIARHFIEKFCTDHPSLPKDITAQALKKLQNHTWPGNVRELENTINRAMAICESDEIGPDILSFALPSTELSLSNSVDTPYTLRTIDKNGHFKNYKELESEIIRMALSYHDNNISKTARVLGIAKSTLYTKIEKLADSTRIQN